jgi:murein DD-endopeptidase MepM/ murein hydrolase activator NlpD
MPCLAHRELATGFASILLVATGSALAAAAPAVAQSGGSAAPVKSGPAAGRSGGAAPTPRLRATTFKVTPGAVAQDVPLRFTWRIDGPVRRSTARVELIPSFGGAPVRVALGTRRIGRRSTRTWTPAGVAPGRYVARLHATGPHRARLRRTARASGRLALEITAAAPAPAPAPAPVVPATLVGRGLFPVQGPYTLGGADARFGAKRSGHVHQGQDIIAAEGTPVVTPVAGLVHWRAYQAAGAGHYVVVRGDDGRDYAFMHMQDGSVLAQKGLRVAAGERLGSVGDTGVSDGAHLHFEIWPDGWYATPDSHPIDPLPELLAWASAS